MTYKQVSELIESFGLPYAYYEFPQTQEAPPFICFLFTDSDDLLADDTNYAKIRPLSIELYTDTKDFALESRIETALNEAGLVFTRSEVYIDSERMFQIVYNTSVTIDDVAINESTEE